MAFAIGNVNVAGRLLLSPMAGFSDSPYRRIVRSLGNPLSITEFISTEQILNRDEFALNLCRFEEAERPISFQVFGNDEETIVEACKYLQDQGPDLIDLNVGCSVRNVALKGSGAGLLRDPVKLGRIMAAMNRKLTVPVTAKIRLGWDDGNLNYMEVGRILADSGAQALAVHGRTRAQGYKGKAGWQQIGELKQSLTIPVIGNGDIQTRQAAFERLSQYKLDAVMIGRGAQANPWIFTGKGVPENSGAVVETLQQHAELFFSHYKDEQARYRFRKHAFGYLRFFENGAEFKPAIINAAGLRELKPVFQALKNRQLAGQANMVA